MRAVLTQRFGFSLQFPGSIGAAPIVNEHVASGGEQLSADRETDTLSAGGDQGAFAVELMHGKKGRTVDDRSL